MKIAIVNESTLVSDDDVKRCATALQTQVDRDFFPIWGQDAQLEFLPKGSTLDPDMWELVVLDNSDQAEALGYHELSANGYPLGKIFAGSDIQAGTLWTVTASHELLEMLADPWINTVAQVNGDDGSIMFFAYEVCDAVEADSLGYPINGIQVSDFVTPEWFMPGWPNKAFDNQGHVNQALQLLPDGYISIWRPDGHGWQQVTAQLRPGGPPVPKGSRRHRRMEGKNHSNQWLRSAR